MLSQTSQSQSILYDSIYVKGPEQANPQRQTIDEQFPGTGAERGKQQEQRVIDNVYMVSFRGDGSVLKLGCGDS